MPEIPPIPIKQTNVDTCNVQDFDYMLAVLRMCWPLSSVHNILITQTEEEHKLCVYD